MTYGGAEVKSVCCAEQRESTTTGSNGNNDIILINNRYFIKFLLWAKHYLKGFTGVNFGISLRGATIIVILLMKTLSPERLWKLPKGTQLEGGRFRSKPGKFGSRATGLWIKSEVLDAHILECVLSHNHVRGGCNLLTLHFSAWPAQWFAYHSPSIQISEISQR